MKYTQHRDIKKRLVRYLRLAYKINNEWLNEDFEVLSLSANNSPEVYEQYPWNNENYPIVVVGGAGGIQDDWAVDSYLQNIWRNKKIGSIPRTYMTLDSDTVAAFGVKVTDYDFKIRDVGIALKQGKAGSDYDVMVTLMSSGSLGPENSLASGSVSAVDISSKLDWGLTELVPEYTLTKNTEYFVKLHLAHGSYGNYYLMIDDSPDVSITPLPRLALSGSLGWSITPGTTPLAILHGPVYKQLGGGVYANFSIYIEAKDLASTQKISELTFVYLNLLRHANIQRISNMTYPNATGTDFDRMAALADLGITVININKGSESVRERGNDRIFSISLDVSCYGRWTETYEMPTLQRIEEIIENY